MEHSRTHRTTELLADLSPPDENESLRAAPRLGKYRLLACLGRGGMGDVFLAMSQGLAGFDKLVVVKQLRPHLAADPEYLTMFLDEARLAARFSHPNIVQTNEIGHDAIERYFMAMEYLDGQTYDRVLHRAHALGGLPLPLQLHVLTCALDALHYAHTLKTYDGVELNFVHRDVSPQNVFLTYQGECKVLDFGVAKVAGSTVKTRPGTYKGKLGFMAPEQMHGDAVDRRADIFAVGVMLWTALAGRSPWHGMVNVEIGRRLFAGEIPSVRRAGREVDGALASICERATAPSVAERYQTADEMRADLDAHLESLGLSVTRKDLAEVLQKLFSRDQLRMRRFVEEQVRRIRVAPASDGGDVALPVVDSASASSLAPVPGPGPLWVPRGQPGAARAGRGSLRAAARSSAFAAAAALRTFVLERATRLRVKRPWLKVQEAARSLLDAALDRLELLIARRSWKHAGAAALSALVVAAAALLFMRERPSPPAPGAPAVVVRIPAIELKVSEGRGEEEAQKPPAPDRRSLIELAPRLPSSVRSTATLP